MLAKCTNSSCSASFRRLAEGQLFRLENVAPSGSSSTMATEYYWLCERCSIGMTLHLAQDGKVLATGLEELIRNGPQLALISRQRLNGRSLRSVDFFGNRHPSGT